MTRFRVALALALAIGVGAEAQPAQQQPDPNQVKTMVKEAGRPVEVIFNDGRTISFKSLTFFRALKTTATLSDNTCNRKMGNKIPYVVPVVVRAIVPFWLKHPTKQGQPVSKKEADEEKPSVASESRFFTRLNHRDFNAQMRLMDYILDKTDGERLEALRETGAFGWLECGPNGVNCAGILPPKTSEIVYWDENFELNNSEITMSSGGDSPSVTQYVSRLQSVPLQVRQDRMYFGIPGRSFGFFADFLPPGVSYQLTWLFDSPNLVEVGDPSCQIKWDLDFTQIFTQFTGFAKLYADPETVKLETMRTYLFQPADASIDSLDNLFNESNWTSSEIIQ